MCVSAETPAPDDARPERNESRPDGTRSSFFPPSTRRGRTGCGTRPLSCWPRLSRWRWWSCSANCRRCAPSAVFALHRRGGAGAVATARRGHVARRRPRRQSGRDRGGQRRRCRHAGSGGAARPRRPRHPPQCRRRPARAGAAQERTRAVRAALAGNHHRAARGHRNHRDRGARPISITCRSIAGWN